VDTSDPVVIVALVGVGLAVIDLLLALWFLRWMRRVRRAQEALLAGKNVDLVEFAVGMQTRMEQVEGIVRRVDGDMVVARARIDACHQRRALVRYDAIKDVGGHQSTSLALLDDRGSGLVISAIQGRDYARIYVKDVVGGAPGSIELTPEERQAVDRAMA
jgi:hypothetical protein